MKTTIHSILRSSAFLFAATLAASLAAQTTDNVKHRDKSFFEKAANCGTKEIAVSQAVMGTLTNPLVREFATTMVSDHTAANNELMALAARKGVVVTTEAKKDAELAEKWSEKGGNVDKKYLHEMIEDHEDAVKLFEKASKSDDADVAAFAQKTLPTLMHHLSMAKDLKKGM